jgi:hypothetical protein
MRATSAMRSRPWPKRPSAAAEAAVRHRVQIFRLSRERRQLVVLNAVAAGSAPHRMSGPFAAHARHPRSTCSLKKPISNSLISVGRSCCTQWPTPGMRCLPTKRGTLVSRSSYALPVNLSTPSSEPVAKTAGCKILAPSRKGNSSQFRSKFRYQLIGPESPIA